MAYWRSWTPPEIPDELRSSHSWGGGMVDYAVSVYFGTDPGHVPRPWVEYAVDSADHEQMLMDSVVELDITQTFVNYSYSLGFEFQEAMEAEVWDWPRETWRWNGEIVTSPRNIVDTGALRDSQQIEFFGV